MRLQPELHPDRAEQLTVHKKLGYTWGDHATHEGPVAERWPAAACTPTVSQR